MRRSRRLANARIASALAAGMPLLLGGCASAERAIDLQGLDGRTHAPLQLPPDAVHVLIFTSHECPIANGYAPTLGRLAAAWQRRPRVRLFLVHCDPDLTPAQAREHAADYELPGTILMDPGQQLAAACGATITPEAVVVTARGQLYRGRIDDQWRKLGSRAPAASQHDLADAVARALDGRSVPGPHPKAVGCLLPEPRKAP